MHLNEAQIRKIDKPGIYAVECGVPGFSFRLSASGGRSWVLRALMHGKRREMGLGACKDVPMAKAVCKAAGARSLLDRGLDPFEVFERGRQARNQYLIGGRSTPPPADVPLLTAVYVRHISDNKLIEAFQEFVAPRLADFPLCMISREDLAATLAPIGRVETRRQIEAALEGVFRASELPWPPAPAVLRPYESGTREDEPVPTLSMRA